MTMIRLSFSSSQDITIGTTISTYQTLGWGFHWLSVGLTLISDNINLGKGNAYFGSYLRGFCLRRLFSWAHEVAPPVGSVWKSKGACYLEAGKQKERQKGLWLQYAFQGIQLTVKTISTGHVHRPI